MKSLVIQDTTVSCRMVIFDKDGTLIHFTETYVPLIRRRAELVSDTLGGGAALTDLLVRAWGIDPVSGSVDPAGPCPVAFQSEEVIMGASILYGEGIPWLEAKRIVETAFRQADVDTDRPGLAVPVSGARELLEDLKKGGFLLGLATGDDRSPTDAMLQRLSMALLFDVVLCAEDVSAPKPDPGILLACCNRADG